MSLSSAAVINHKSRHHSRERICGGRRPRADRHQLAHVMRYPAGLDRDVRHAARDCGDNSETARMVGDARRRREKVLQKIERRLQRRPRRLILRWVRPRFSTSNGGSAAAGAAGRGGRFASDVPVPGGTTVFPQAPTRQRPGTKKPARKRRLVDASRSTVPTAFNSNSLEPDFVAITASARARPTSVTPQAELPEGCAFRGPESQGGLNEFRND